MSIENPLSHALGSPDPEIFGDQESGMEELLREVGARDEPSEQITAAVREAVRAEWLATLRRRSRRRVLQMALAAGVMGLAFATVLRVQHTEPAWVAHVVRIEGQPRAQLADSRRPVQLGETLQTGTRLQTLNARVALEIGNPATLSLRIDAGSQVLIKSRGLIELQAGALYVDASADARATPLTITTAAGTVRHLGTQYQVRTLSDPASGIEVSIREGRVEITNDFGKNTGVAGERVAVSSTGSIERRPLPPYDSRWQWAAKIAPPFDIADRSLNTFLEWVARETGRELVYDSPAAQRAAGGVMLFGSIAGLDPDTALTAVLSTTKFKRLPAAESSLRIKLTH